MTLQKGQNFGNSEALMAHLLLDFYKSKEDFEMRQKIKELMDPSIPANNIKTSLKELERLAHFAVKNGLIPPSTDLKKVSIENTFRSSSIKKWYQDQFLTTFQTALTGYSQAKHSNYLHPDEKDFTYQQIERQLALIDPEDYKPTTFEGEYQKEVEYELELLNNPAQYAQYYRNKFPQDTRVELFFMPPSFIAQRRAELEKNKLSLDSVKRTAALVLKSRHEQPSKTQIRFKEAEHTKDLKEKLSYVNKEHLKKLILSKELCESPNSAEEWTEFMALNQKIKNTQAALFINKNFIRHLADMGLNSKESLKKLENPDLKLYYEGQIRTWFKDKKRLDYYQKSLQAEKEALLEVKNSMRPRKNQSIFKSTKGSITDMSSRRIQMIDHELDLFKENDVAAIVRKLEAQYLYENPNFESILQ